MNTGYPSIKFLLIALFWILWVSTSPVFGQENGDIEITASPEKNKQAADSVEASGINKDTTRLSPRRASLYSMVLPGLGQAYNSEYWKIPIVYSGGLALGYFIDYYNTNYHIYRRALLSMTEGTPPRPNPFPDYVNRDRLSRGKDFFRRNRDFVIILSAGLYLLQAVDAHVDAHLKEFTITEDLSMELNPKVEKYATYATVMGRGQRQIGIGVSLNFKLK